MLFLRKAIIHTLSHSEQQIPLIGAIGFVSFPLYYFLWNVFSPQHYDSFFLRMVGSVLCLGLLLMKFWPRFLRPVFPVWLFTALLYSLSFLPLFLLLKNNFTTMPLLTALVSLFLLILVVDVWSIPLLFFTGAVIAWIAYFFSTAVILPLSLYTPYILVFLFTIFAGMILNGKLALIQKQKFDGMAAVSSNIAHELRTPLLGIKSGAVGLKRYIPILFEGYQQAKKHGLPVTPIRSGHYKNLLPVVEHIEIETNYANTIIDILLMNVAKPKRTLEGSIISIEACITEALNRYPFQSQSERDKISWRKGNEFQLWGPKIMVVHVFFNLIKNALYFIAKAEKGGIFIWCEQGRMHNELHFKDTGQGIPSIELSRLFERFYSTTTTGTGIGLAFCKMVMESIHGEIACYSKEGSYTEFVLRFPRLDKNIAPDRFEASFSH